MSEDLSIARTTCTVGASQLKERVSAMIYAQSKPLGQDALLAAVQDTLPASLSTVHHHHNLLGVLLFENETDLSINGGCSVFVAAAAMDTLALRRGGVSPGNECVWCAGEAPGQRRYFDAASNVLEYVSAKTTPRPGSPRASRGASLTSSSPSSLPWSSSTITRRKSWVANCLRSGACWTSPYPDPITGRLIESYVMPIESSRAANAIMGVVVAGSFLVGKNHGLQLSSGETFASGPYTSHKAQLPLTTPTAAISRAAPVAPSMAATASSLTVSPIEVPTETQAMTAAVALAVSESTSVTQDAETGHTKVAPAPVTEEEGASGSIKTHRMRTSIRTSPSSPASASARESSREMLFNGVRLSRGLSAAKYATFFAEKPSPPPLRNSMNTRQCRATAPTLKTEHDDLRAVGSIVKPAIDSAATTVGSDTSAAKVPSGQLLVARNANGFGSSLRGRQAPPPLTVPTKARLADVTNDDNGTGKRNSDSGPESGSRSGTKISIGSRNCRSRSQSPRGHGYRSPPLLSSPLTKSPSSADWVIRGRDGSHKLSVGSNGSNSSSRSSSRGSGSRNSTGSVLLSSPRRESPSPFAGVLRPSSSWLEVDLANEMELEHGLEQPFTQPFPITTAAAAPVEEVAVPDKSTASGAHPAMVNSSSATVPNAPAYGLLTHTNAQRASPLPSPLVPLPTPVLHQTSPLAQKASNTSRQSPPPPPPAEESMLAGSLLAARSAELLVKARSERSRLRKLRILINESSPERLAAVLSTEPAEAAKARGKAAADLDARGAALAAARAAAHAAGVADARASIQRPPSSPPSRSSPSPTKQLLDPLAAAEFDALLALSPEAMAAIHGDEGEREEDDVKEEEESSGTVPQSTGPRRRPPQHRTSRRLKRSSARSTTPVSPRTESSNPSNTSSIPGLGVVTGLLRRIGFGSPGDSPPSEKTEKSNAAIKGELKSSRRVATHTKVAAIPAEIRTSTSISPGSSSDNDDDFHSADEGDEG